VWWKRRLCERKWQPARQATERGNVGVVRNGLITPLKVHSDLAALFSSRELGISGTPGFIVGNELAARNLGS
jgi:hypothetical protein